MSWIALRYVSGFRRPSLSWFVAIEADGYLVRSGLSPCAVQLTPQRLTDLQRLVRVTDFEAVAAAHTHVTDDGAAFYLTVEDSSGPHSFSAPARGRKFWQRVGPSTARQLLQYIQEASSHEQQVA